ncbi:hypothetical protein KDA_75310 [Dictyobacter alpinus]|uniref:TraD/TraG TraM recognition site domain-containing protein n=1 Tax=Dictyobacter alpinus TaxID=2014873 RepID=A0A402BL07_9CHLR|nr:hypothetical protein [Dictyobacter alpinus]GCE32047.1 hypothetical protein KDA_75310 [Dictyobacter alpinus]
MHYSSWVSSEVVRRSYRSMSAIPFTRHIHPRANDPSWEFGWRMNGNWRRLLHLPEESYALDLASHAGVIVGLSEEGVHMTQLRIAVNAARQGWKVVLFDAQSSERKAAEFVAAMRQAGLGDTYVSSRTDEHGTTERTSTAHGTRTDGDHSYPEISPHALDDALQCLLGGKDPFSDMSAHIMPPHGLLEQVRREPFEEPPPAVPYESANAVYLGLNVWEGAQEAQDTAQACLSDFTRFLSTTRTRHVLLLIEHPALLFNMQEICPLFALLEQAQGSMFVSARSVADFGKEAPRLLKNARTLIAHRSTPEPFEPYVSQRGWNQRPFFGEAIRQFHRDECFVIHAGQATPVRVNPIFIDTDGVVGSRLSPRPSTDGPAAARIPWLDLDIQDAEFEEFLASAFGPLAQDRSNEQAMPPQRKGARQTRPRRGRTRSAELLSNDRSHLRSALSLLGREH